MTDRTGELLDLAETSRGNIVAFLGDEPPCPALVLCAMRACARPFGIDGNGLSIPDMAVMVSSGGLTEGTLTHGMTHSQLHRCMGQRNLVRQPYPTWLDEGLITHVADHPLWPGQVSVTAQRRAGPSIRRCRR